jgi:hypothetical protein
MFPTGSTDWPLASKRFDMVDKVSMMIVFLLFF